MTSLKEEVLHISDLERRSDLFEYSKTEKGIEHYKPLRDIFIEAIDVDTGNMAWKKIVDYTKHHDLQMYSVSDPFNRFNEFWVSDDHSLIAYMHSEDKLIKISPKDILKDVDNFALVKRINDDEMMLIPAFELLIELDQNKTEAYDFTVEDYFTFATSDGVFLQDTMAIFMPLSLEAQEDCRKMCIPTGVTNVTQSSIEIKHELALCSFTITDDSKPKSQDLGIMSLKELSENPDIGIQPDKHVWQTLTVRLYTGKTIKTTLGRAVFNAIFPADFLKEFYDGFINKQINKKVLNDDILQNLLKKYERETVGTIVDKIVHVLTRYSSAYPSSLVLSEFLEASMFNDLKEKYKKSKTMMEKQAIIEEIEKRIKNDIGKKMPMINNIVASGSRGNPNQIRQVMVTKGILQDPQGNFLSIDESYIDGLSPTSTFLGGFGSRKGIMDRSRSTAVTGYLYRKMIYALASVILDKELVDCGTKKTIKCKITKDNAKLLYGRYIIDRAKVLLSKDNIEDYYGQYVDLRTPIYCKSLKLCKTCYGNLMGFYNSPYVGIIAAQSLGERGSQEIMKTFHTGGSTEVSIPDILQQAADNNPLTSRDILDKYFVQENTKLKFKDGHEVVIELYHSDYFNLGITEFTLDQEKSGIIVSNMNIPGTMIKSAISLKPFVAKIIFKSGEKILDEFEFIVDDKIFLPYELFEIEEYRNSETDKDKIIRLKANTKDIPFFINIDLSSSDMNVLMQTILGIIEKKNIMKYPEIAFNKLTKIYGEKFNVAYNHIEILVSQIFRNAKRPEVPARLIEPYEAKVHGIKNIAHLESFLSGMLFENMSKSLLNGFINDSVIHNPLERLLSDDFDFE